MKQKVIVLAGKAGSGKDTVGNYIVSKYGGACLGQADPMKRFAKKVFRFSDEQLWGPSDMRNAPDPAYSNIDLFDLQDSLDVLDARFYDFADEWVEGVLPDLTIEGRMRSLDALESWFAGVVSKVARHGGLSPRYVLQTLGTEWGRAQSQSVWSAFALRTAFTLLGGGYTYSPSRGLVSPKASFPAFFGIKPAKVQDLSDKGFAIITDGRFRNEMSAVIGAGGAAIRIVRPDASLSAAAEASGIPGHLSERELNEIPDDLFTKVIVNDGTLDQLFSKVDAVLGELYGSVS